MSDKNEVDEGAARKIIADWYHRHGLHSVPIRRADIEAITERGEAAGWTPEQYRDAMSELIQKKTGQLIDETDKPAT
jgi:hypothetical protein